MEVRGSCQAWWMLCRKYNSRGVHRLARRLFPQQKKEGQINSVFFDYSVSVFERQKGTSSETGLILSLCFFAPTRRHKSAVCGLLGVVGYNSHRFFRATRGETGRVRFSRCSSLQPSVWQPKGTPRQNVLPRFIRALWLSSVMKDTQSNYSDSFEKFKYFKSNLHKNEILLIETCRNILTILGNNDRILT